MCRFSSTTRILTGTRRREAKIASERYINDGFFSVDRTALWAAARRAMQATRDRAPAEATQLGVNEVLLGVLCQVDKPEYIGERWRSLERGETWETQPSWDSNPALFMPIEHLIHLLAGRLRYLGFTWWQAGEFSWLPALGVEPALCRYLLHGRPFREAAAEHGLTDVSPGWPADLGIIEKDQAAALRSSLDRAIDTFRTASGDYANRIHRSAFQSSHNRTDRTVLSDLAKLDEMVAALEAADVEILVGQIRH
jgi:hypothetical protein